MRVLGRILQIVGWLWLVGAIAASILGNNRFSIFPGLILIFFARVIRAQRARTEPRTSQEAGQPETSPPERVLNTERRQRPPATSSQPQVSYSPTAAPPEDEGEDRGEQSRDERGDLLERIVAAGREETVDPEPAEPTTPGLEPEANKPMSSDEMIARAHRRWDSK